MKKSKSLKKSEENFIGRYLILLTGIGALVFLKMIILNQSFNVFISFLVGAFYFLYGITHHKAEKNLNTLIVIEFLIISLLIGFIMYNIG